MIKICFPNICILVVLLPNTTYAQEISFFPTDCMLLMTLILLNLMFSSSIYFIYVSLTYL